MPGLLYRNRSAAHAILAIMMRSFFVSVLGVCLLAVLSLMSAGCRDDSTQRSTSIIENCESEEDRYSAGESPGEAADGTVSHRAHSVLLNHGEPIEASGKLPESQAVYIHGGITVRCCAWEVFVPILKASGRGGGILGIDSSSSGCFRVCYLETHPGEAFSEATDLVLGETTFPGKAILRFSRSDLSTPDPTTPTPGESKIAPVAGIRTVDINPANSGEDPTLGLVFKINNSPSEHLAIRVASNLRQCVVWNTDTDQAEFRSALANSGL